MKNKIIYNSIMSFFNKGLMRFRPVSLFNKAAGVGRSIFNKAPQALARLSGGLGQASRSINAITKGVDSAVSNPEVRSLARSVGAGGVLGGIGGLTGTAGSVSSLLGRASQATSPSSYSGMSAAGAAGSAVERAKALGGAAKQLFV